MDQDLQQILTIYKLALPRLSASIVKYLNATSEPMSESLVKIKTSIANFLTKVQASKATIEGKDCIETVRSGIHILSNQLSMVTKETSCSYTQVSQEIVSLDTQMNAILDLVANISDVAERIHVLSINASIEAARAGIHGKGFKVIADEVQRLSRETQNFVTTIGSSVEGTQKAFSSLHTTMERNKKEVESFVIDDSTTFANITESLEKQLAQVMSLFSEVFTFTDSLSIDMSAFAPIGILHAVITQEIENLALVQNDLADTALSLIGETQEVFQDSYEQKISEDEAIKKGIDLIRKRLTTSRELDALEEALRSAGVDIGFNLQRNNTEIEFF